VNGKPWTPEQLELLRKLYPDTQTCLVAEACGHSLESTYRYAQNFGLSKSAAFRDSPASGRLKFRLHVGAATRFSKGHVPANKGLRRPGWSVGRGRMQETQFKKGQRTQTWQPIGTEVTRKDGYIWLKVSDDARPARRNWKSKHQATWEREHGPLPPGHVVVFRNGDKRNFANDNLELITRAELGRRNSLHRYPAELVRVIQLRGALQRQINRRSPAPKPRRGRPPKRRDAGVIA
jgi:hypothetical protein